jgi:predicted secreted hydrolase
MKLLFVVAVLLSTTLLAAGLFAAPFAAAPVGPDLAAARAAALKADAENFQLALTYIGPSDKPYYNLLLSVQKPNVLQADPSFLKAQITEAEALQLITHLQTSGLLAQAVDAKTTKFQDQSPSYRLTATAGDQQLTTSLSWNLDTLKHLDALRKPLTGEAANRMDTLLARLSGHRREWTAKGK